MSSVVDREPTLGELLEPDGIREVAKSFSDLYGMGVRVFDEGGAKIVDVRGRDINLAGYLFKQHQTRVELTQLVNRLRVVELKAKGGLVTEVDFVGLVYKVAPIVHHGSILGRLIFGPFRRPGAKETRETVFDGVDSAELAKFIREVPQAPEASVDQLVTHLLSIVDVIVHSSYKALMTSRLHVASTTEQFDKLDRSNRELMNANQQLRELDQLKSNFISTVSHELRTPLTSVIGYSEMLLEGLAGDINEEQSEYISTILEKGESLLGLISQVLDLSRIESGNVVMLRTVTDVGELLRLASTDVAPQAKKRKLNLDISIEDEVEPISVDRDKIRRAVTNLLGNAVKFTPEGGTIDVRASVIYDDFGDGTEDNRFDIFEPERIKTLRMDVRDSGIGIPEEKLEHIFDTFFQVDNTATRQFGGTGLGLSIARNFVVAHRGRVQVESKPGAGSTFSIFLPYVEEQEGRRVPKIEGVRLHEPRKPAEELP